MHPHRDDGADADRRRPRWVVVTAVIALLAALLLLILLLAGGHGPGRHLSSAGPAGGPLAVTGAGAPDAGAGPRP